MVEPSVTLPGEHVEAGHVVRHVDVVTSHSNATGNTRRIRCSHKSRRQRVTDVDDLKSGIPVADVGVPSRNDDVGSIAGRVDSSHYSGYSGVVDIDYPQAGSTVSDVGVVTFYSYPIRKLCIYGPDNHRRLLVANVDDLQAVSAIVDVGEVASNRDATSIPRCIECGNNCRGRRVTDVGHQQSARPDCNKGVTPVNCHG